MNCKPGDLAYYANSGRNYGTLVTVGAAWKVSADGRTKFGAFTMIGNGPAWMCRAVGRPLIQPFAGKEVQFYETPIADSSLRPIRNPGDDAVDETLINNPVRQTESA